MNDKKNDNPEPEPDFPSLFEEGVPECSPDQLSDLPLPDSLVPLAESKRPGSMYRSYGVN